MINLTWLAFLSNPCSAINLLVRYLKYCYSIISKLTVINLPLKHYCCSPKILVLHSKWSFLFLAVLPLPCRRSWTWPRCLSRTSASIPTWTISTEKWVSSFSSGSSRTSRSSSSRWDQSRAVFYAKQIRELLLLHWLDVALPRSWA